MLSSLTTEALQRQSNQISSIHNNYATVCSTYLMYIIEREQHQQ